MHVIRVMPALWQILRFQMMLVMMICAQAGTDLDCSGLPSQEAPVMIANKHKLLFSLSF